MSRKSLTKRVNAYLYHSGNAKASKAQNKIARGGMWTS